MATSSNSKATSSQLVNAYLNGLKEEFELHSSASKRFNVYPGNLKTEFELLSVEIESLRKERDEYKAKVNIDRTIICERCSKETASTPGIVVPSQARRMKTTSLFSSRFFQFKSRDQPEMSDPSSQEVALTQKRRSTQQMTVIQRLHSAITPTRPSQFTSRSLDTDITLTIAPPSPEPFASIADAGSGPEDRNWSIIFTTKAEQELEVELTHALFHEKTILCVKFSQDGKSLAAGCRDGKAYIYDVETGTLTCFLRNLLAEPVRIMAACFSPNGKYLATGTHDEFIYIWEIKEKCIRNAFRGHTNYIQSLDFSPNGRLLVSASQDNTVRLWNMRDGSEKILIEHIPTFLDLPHYYSAVFSPDGRYVAAGHRDGIVRMWDVRTGRLMRRLNMQVQDYQEYWRWTDVKFMPDGKRLVSASGGRTFQSWDISTLGATRTTDDFDPGVEEQIQPEREFSGHKNLVHRLAISPDGRWVASGASDRSVLIWDTRNAVMQCILDNVHESVYSVDMSPSGHYLASGGKGGMVKIWRYSYMAPRGSGLRTSGETPQSASSNLSFSS